MQLKKLLKEISEPRFGPFESKYLGKVNHVVLEEFLTSAFLFTGISPTIDD